MSLTLHTLAPKKGARTKAFRIGRGEGSGRGKTAGKGTKGQRARTGGRRGLKLLGMRQMLLSTPKLRGFKSRYLKAATVTLPKLSQVFSTGERVDLKILKIKKLVHPSSTRVKIVGTEGIDKPLKFVNVMASQSAKAAIEKAGGSFECTKTTTRTKASKVKKAKRV